MHDSGCSDILSAWRCSYDPPPHPHRRNGPGKTSSRIHPVPDFGLSTPLPPPLAIFLYTCPGSFYGLNKPLFGSAFCPLLGRRGASARLSSCSRKLGCL